MSSNGLAIVAAKLILELLGPEQLPDAAIAALENGLDSPALVSLAGLSNTDVNEARPLFERALGELGVPIPSPREASIRLAREVAAEIVRGTVTPYAGAKQICDLVVHVPIEQVPELHPFIYAADEWEDRPDERMHFERGIIREAQALVGA